MTLLEELAAREARIAELEQALADAAQEIPCAGPVAHRIRVLKDEHAARLAALEAELVQSRRDVAQYKRSWETCERLLNSHGVQIDTMRLMRDDALGNTARLEAKLAQARAIVDLATSISATIFHGNLCPAFQRLGAGPECTCGMTKLRDALATVRALDATDPSREGK